MKSQLYQPFNNFIFRTPLLSIQSKNIELTNSNYFNEAIFLASPEFNKETQKGETSEKMMQSLYKYFSRSFSRCTPFGLFAGCSVGNFDEKTDLRLKPLKDYTRRTRFDMNYICALIQKIENEPALKDKLKYFPNDSMYDLAGKRRYVEYYYRGVQRIHNIISVDDNEYFDKILDASKIGATIKELASVVVDEEITFDDAKEFIEELIASQILKSELEAQVTGENPLNRLIEQLQVIKEKKYLPILLNVQLLLKKIDSSVLGESYPIYTEIINLIKNLEVDYELKYLFQADLYKPTLNAMLDIKFTNKANDLFLFLNNVTPKRDNENLNRFKEAFSTRYEDREVSLAKVLDRELGIGYPTRDDNSSDISVLVDDLIMPNIGRSNSNTSITFNAITNIMLEKYMAAMRSGSNTIELEDSDFKFNTETNSNDLPDTISMMCNIVIDNNENYKTIVKIVGGSSAANLMGRFCHVDSKIYNLVKSITEKEQELSKDAILVEIAHLPESRIGNIVLRPKLREYEIKYLAASCVEIENQLTISDIMISVKGNRVVLRSKMLNKEIIPHLTNAHNFSFNSMPAYHFLCDMQMQNKKNWFGLSWNGIFDSFEYLPRIEYKDFILSLQKWRIKKNEIEGLNKLSDEELIDKFKTIREKYRISKEVTLDEGDNELYVDLENALSIRTFLSAAKKHSTISLSEFVLGDFSSPVTDGNDYFNNEFIIPFYKNTRL